MMTIFESSRVLPAMPKYAIQFGIRQEEENMDISTALNYAALTAHGKESQWFLHKPQRVST